MPYNHLILCHPLLLLPSIFPSIRVFSSESVLYIRWPKYWNFSFSIRPSNEYSELISFRMDWLDLLEVQGTLKSLLQHHSSKASILWHSAFFMVQLSHPYTTTGKTKEQHKRFIKHFYDWPASSLVWMYMAQVTQKEEFLLGVWRKVSGPLVWEFGDTIPAAHFCFYL